MFVLKQKKSKKDLAFEKERIKFRSEIRNLTNCLNDKQRLIDELNEIVREKDVIIYQQKEWIDRLLKYTELSEDDMKKLIVKEKAISEIIEHFQSVNQIMGKLNL